MIYLSKQILIFSMFVLILAASSPPTANATTPPEEIPTWAQSYYLDSPMGGTTPETAQIKSDRLTAQFDAIFESVTVGEAEQVIIEVDADFKPEGFLTTAEVTAQRADILTAQEGLINALKAKDSYYNTIDFEKYESVPYILVAITQEDSADFLDLADILNVYADEDSAPPAMWESKSIIGADTAMTNGFTGSGQVVAVLDTGIDKTHPALISKVVSEACYSSNRRTFTSLCPGGGVKSSTAVGSGVNCSSTVSGCDHGTHIAGIIAGNDGMSSHGVAPDANLISINVFSSENGVAKSRRSDQIKGLSRVLALSDTFTIAAVALNVYSGSSASPPCDYDPPRKKIIDNLRSVGIATIIPSGNNGFSDRISKPACISSAIAVGSTDDGSNGTTADVVSSFSNSSNLVDMLAPGQSITSSIPGSTHTSYAAMAGTSQAAAHVAGGAFAVIKSAFPPLATPDEIEATLQTEGAEVTDSKNGIIKPRINLYDTVDKFKADGVTVVISTAEAKADGAQWRVGNGAWKNSGEKVTGLAVGHHNIIFKTTPHPTPPNKMWITPVPINIKINYPPNMIMAFRYIQRNR